jgi:hypothetical protein
VVPAGGYSVWYYQWALTTSGGITHGASYRVDGASTGSFDLVTGEWFRWFPSITR